MTSAYLDDWFQHVAKTLHDYFIFLKLSSLTYSQIWLIPLVDDHPRDCITKLKKETMVEIESSFQNLKLADNSYLHGLGDEPNTLQLTKWTKPQLSVNEAQVRLMLGPILVMIS